MLEGHGPLLSWGCSSKPLSRTRRNVKHTFSRRCFLADDNCLMHSDFENVKMRGEMYILEGRRYGVISSWVCIMYDTYVRL